MVCRLCLIKTDNNLAIFSDDKIPKYIAKYLQLEITRDDPISNVVCTLCWTQLQNFKIFHLQVMDAQKTLATVCEDFKNENNQNVSDSDVSGNALISSNIEQIRITNIVEVSDGMPVVTIEQHSNKFLETTATTEANETLANQMIIAETKHPNESTLDKDISSNIEVMVTNNCYKNEKKQEGEHPEPAKDKTSEECITNVNSKPKRNRGRSGQKKLTKQKVKSEKSNRILRTAKEFDDIIKKNMDLKCEICSAKVVDFAELIRHFRTVHNRPGYVICCNKRLFKRFLVVDHIKMHTNPEYFKCTECGKVLADRMCLRVHELLSHKNEEDKMFQCPQCPKKFAKQYLIHHHKVKRIPQKDRTFTCSDCGRGFPTQITLTKHSNKIHSTIYDKMCEICAKLIHGKAAFERHMEEHDGVVRPQVQCGICGTLLKDKHILRKHMLNKHDGKSHACNVCGKSAPSKSALQSHHKHMHQNVRDFKCTFCDKSFKKAINLREHLTTHTKEVLYTCPYCPKTFSFNSNMHAHRKKEHREEWEANRRSNVKKAAPTDT